MPTFDDNPYSASQVLPAARPGSLWQSLFYRTVIGIIVGAALYGFVLITFPSVNQRGAIFLFVCSVIVAAASTFTQSDSAKKSGRTGIIAAMMLWIASMLISAWLSHAFGFTRPHLRGRELESPQGVTQELIIWSLVYLVLVSGYFFLCCRKENEFPNSNEVKNSV